MASRESANFPPKVVALIGSEGLMGRRHLRPFWERAGLKVIGADVPEKRVNNPDLVDNRTAAAAADIINISVLPMIETWNVLAEIKDVIRPGALVLLSPTVLNPFGFETLELEIRLLRNGIDIGQFHLMFGPSVDDWEGQNVAVGFRERMRNKRWRLLIHRFCRKERLVIWPVSFASHDEATTFSQLNNHVGAYESGVVWEAMIEMGYSLEELIEFMPPTGYLPAYGIIAILRQSDLSAELLTLHRNAEWLIDLRIEALQKMKAAVAAHDAKQARALYPELPMLKRRAEVIRLRTQMHVRLEGGLRGGGFMYWLDKASNKIGRLARMLHIFDVFELHKTQTFASEDPSDGSATILITVTQRNSPQAQAAHVRLLNDDTIGAKELEPVTPHGRENRSFFREEGPIA